MNRLHYTLIMPTPIGKLGIQTDEEGISAVSWLSENYPLVAPETTLTRQVSEVLNDYFTAGKALPPLPLNLSGTKFQLKTWYTLLTVPWGKVVSYGELARRLGTGSRAVGQACRSNPVVLFVPCHRVVAKSGLGGYMGGKKRLNIKQWLLRHEGAL